MNIALATIVLLVILYPGFLFRRFYYSAEFSKEYFKQSIPDMVLASVLPAFLIHILGYCLFVKPSYQLNIQTIGTLLSGTSDSSKVSAAFENIYVHAFQIISYFFAISGLAVIGGLSSKYVVRLSKFDRKSSLFRFQNEWHYVFSGEILDFPNVPGRADEVDFKYVDVLVKSNEGTLIYMGMLSHYTLNKEGGIDRIYLSDTRRRYLKDDKPSFNIDDNRYYNLPGEFFIIPYEQIINLHITYYKVELSPELENEIDSLSINEEK